MVAAASPPIAVDIGVGLVALALTWMFLTYLLLFVNTREFVLYPPSEPASETRANSWCIYGLVRYPGFGPVLTPPVPLLIGPDRISVRGPHQLAEIAYPRGAIERVVVRGRGPFLVARVVPTRGRSLGFYTFTVAPLIEALEQHGWRPTVE